MQTRTFENREKMKKGFVNPKSDQTIFFLHFVREQINPAKKTAEVY